MSLNKRNKPLNPHELQELADNLNLDDSDIEEYGFDDEQEDEDIPHQNESLFPNPDEELDLLDDGITNPPDPDSVMVCRAVQGLSQGFVFPSVHGLLARWVPKSERSRLGTLVYAGKITVSSSYAKLTI
ncbi:unnamed protein product [Phaedon cochleariae]|uniref:Uncharacterized protein n=1 Tax=Phaedon cochleariae TaxID=80249 RepID=A0A9N9SFJ6_PHACE|nr:unnamed protein product [Phaedon cochleariae]